MLNANINKMFNELEKDYVTSYAQCCEDIILLKFLRNVKNGTYVDVGCAHPVRISVSCLFYKQGWRGINIDPREIPIADHNKMRPEDINVRIAVSNKSGDFPFWECGEISTFDYDTVKRVGESKFKKTKVSVKPITKILDQYLNGREIHFVKIDVEKHEKEVLEGLDFVRFRPWMFAIECTLPCTGIPCWNDWESILIRNGYRFAKMHSINRYYIAAEKYDELMACYEANSMLPYLHVRHKDAIQQARHADSDNFISDFVLKSVVSSQGMAPNVAANYAAVIKSAAAREAANSGVSWFNNLERIKIYRRIFELLWPHDAENVTKIKINGYADGGWVMLEPKKVDAALSFGNPASWGIAMANRGIKAFHFQKNAQKPQNAPDNIQFIPKELVADKKLTDHEITFEEIFDFTNLKESNAVILQMNIEGIEWDIFEKISTAVLSKFQQIIVEFHGMDNEQNLPKFIKIFEKLGQTHISIHFHYNNAGHIMACPSFIMSSLFEVSFARKDIAEFKPDSSVYPTKLDTPTLAKYPDVYIGYFNNIATSSTPPPRNVDHLKYAYTLGGKIPYTEWYLDDSAHAQRVNTQEIYKNTILAIKNGTFRYYGATLEYLQNAIRAFPLKGKIVLIAGLTGCNCDALALVHGAEKVIVVDYNPVICQHDKVISMGINEFLHSGIKADVAFSISSYEHDGLGRYGDPLDPDADIKAMANLRQHLKKDGFIYLAVETGPDYIVFNAGRIYGRIRYPMLINGWGFLASFGMTSDIFDTNPGQFGRQPVLVLAANSQAVNIPANVSPVQRLQIEALARHGAFDSQYYISQNPDVLSGQMDPVSHYIIHGCAEGRKPAPWFDGQAYMKNNPDMPWDKVNPFIHYLRPEFFKLRQQAHCG